MSNPADDRPNLDKNVGQQAGDPYPGRPHPGQPYSGQPYPGQPYAGQPYPGQPYAGQPYPGQPYPGQPYPAGGAYGPPGYAPDPSAPWGRHPVSGQPYSDKSKLVAGLLQFFLGCFGVGRFYIGNTGVGLAQLFTCGGLGIWALIDAILILVGNVNDSQGRPLRD